MPVQSVKKTHSCRLFIFFFFCCASFSWTRDNVPKYAAAAAVVLVSCRRHVFIENAAVEGARGEVILFLAGSNFQHCEIKKEIVLCGSPLREITVSYF